MRYFLEINDPEPEAPRKWTFWRVACWTMLFTAIGFWLWVLWSARS